MELGAVQELRKDSGNLLTDDPGAVVRDGDPEAGRLTRGRHSRRSGRHDLQLYRDLRKNPGFLTSIQRVVDRFLDAGQQGFARVVETE